MTQQEIRVRVDNDSKKLLEDLAKRTGLSLTAYVRLVLRQAAKTPFKLKMEKAA